MAENLSLAADCAASLLMFATFIFLVAGTVVLYSAWRALRSARKALPQYLEMAGESVQRVSSEAQRSTDALIRPQIAVASTWAGIRAGATSLIGRGRGGTGSSGEPKRSTDESP